MLKAIYIKSNLKQLFREPMMALLFAVPLMISPLFRLILTYLIPIINRWVEFDMAPYEIYVLVMALLLTPGMLGIVMGFMLLDDKDGKISQLLSITPLGRSGYLTMRLFFVVIGTIIYTFYTYALLGIYIISTPVLLYLSLLHSIFAATFALIFATVATDKVKGLTYAKGLNLILLFALTDLINETWLTNISYFIPTFWITKIALHASVGNILIGTVVHLLWFALFIFITTRQKSI